MAILESDIKLLRSERMLDTPDGGGRRTSHAIIDGQSGNIFPKISRLDSTYGRVNLRKIYAGAMTANLDTYAGAHAAVMDAPDNEQIHVTIFSTGSDFDTRTDARDRIESYVISGPESRMTLYGRQLSGQQSIQVYQRPEEALPNIGDVYCLSKEAGGITAYQQYIRVGDLQHEVRTFEDEKGTYTFRVVVIKIGAALRHEFSGPAAPGRYSQIDKPALVRETTVADAARYYGIVPAAGALTHGSVEIMLESIYSTIVPSTTRDTALSNVEMASAAQLAPAAAESISQSLAVTGLSGASTYTLRTERAIKPGSAIVQALVGDTVIASATDNGAGVFVTAPGSSGFTGTIDYAAGSAAVSPTFTGGGTAIRITYVPAVTVSRPAHTLSVPITLATRGTVYAQTLLPAPAPGTVSVSYRALGRWYTLRDDGAGTLAGLDPSYGAGSIDYATGALVVTLGALPDVDSALQLSWGSRVHQTVRAGATAAADSTLRQIITLVDLPIAPNTLTVSWESGGVTKTAADAGGTLIGHASGAVNRTTGRIVIEYAANVPDSGTALSIEYDKLVPDAPSEPTYRTGSVSVTDITSINLGGVVTPGGLELDIAADVGTVQLVDDGAGTLLTLAQEVGISSSGSSLIQAGQEVGTINYETGIASIASTIGMLTTSWQPSSSAWVSESQSTHAVVGLYTFRVRTGTPANLQPVTVSISAADAPLQLDLTRNVTDTVVPESVAFDFAGQRYIDRAGTLYTAVSAATGSGLEAGTLDYETGIARLTTWANGAAPALAVRACLTQFGEWTAVSVSFRTAGAPVRPASLYVQVNDKAGALITATADVNGIITGARARGHINQQMGNAWVDFGAMVSAAGKEGEPWYDAANVVGGMIWEPTEVLPATLRYNAVIVTSVPLDADILGLDPVRLPSDGRVPIFRPADVLIVHHTSSMTLPNPPVAGATYELGRTDVQDIWLYTTDGVRAHDALYTVDLLAGTVTMADPLDLTGVALPLTARHRIEEMALATDVRINGSVTLRDPLTRDYPAGTKVSTALVFGDLAARVTNLFDQYTWTGAWSDTLIGDQAVGQYNDIDFPVEVTNSGAVSERWRLSFTSATTFQVIGENLGVISSGSTDTDLQPVNRLTGLAYFTLRAAGWGGGMQAGNQLRFNTLPASKPVWCARTVLPGATLDGDSFDLQLRGDVDGY